MPGDVRIGGVYADFRARNAQFIQASRGNVAAMRRQRQSADRLRRSADRLRGSVRNLVGTFAAFAGGALGIRAASRSFLEFDDALVRLRSLIGLSEESVNGFRESLLSLSGNVAQSPAELAEGLFFLASAGFRGEEAMRALVASAQASAVGLGSTESVAEGVTSALGSWGTEALTAEQATAVLIATVREGRFAPEQLAAQIGRLGSVAAELGVEFQEVGASLAFLSRSQDLNLATTRIQGILRVFIKPSELAADALRQVGLSVEGLRGLLVERGFLGALQELRRRFDEARLPLSRLFRDTEGLAALLQLTGEQAEQAEQVFAALANTTENDLARAFEIVQESAGFRLQQGMADLARVATELGAEIIPRLADALVFFSDNVRIVVVAAASLAGALLLRGVTASILSVSGAVGVLTTGLRAATAAARFLGRALLIGALIEGIHLAVVSVINLSRAITETGLTFSTAFRVGTAEALTFVAELALLLPTYMSAALSAVANVVVEGFASLGEAATSVFLAAIRGDNIANALLESVSRGFDSALAAGRFGFELQLAAGESLANSAREAIFRALDIDGTELAQFRNTLSRAIAATADDITRIYGLGDNDVAAIEGLESAIQTLRNFDTSTPSFDGTTSQFREQLSLATDLNRQLEDRTRIANQQVGLLGLQGGELARQTALNEFDNLVAERRLELERQRADLASRQVQIQRQLELAQESGNSARIEQLSNFRDQAREGIVAANEQLEALAAESNALAGIREQWGELAVAVDAANHAQQQFEGAIRSASDAFGRFAATAITDFRDIGNAARQLANTIIQDLINRIIAQPLSSALFGFLSSGLGGIFSGGAAPGGAAGVGLQSGGLGSGFQIVGEAGPELVDFRNPGRVYTNEQLQGAVSGGGGNNFNFAPVIQSSDGPAVRRALLEAFPIFEDRVLATIQTNARRPSSLRSAVRG